MNGAFSNLDGVAFFFLTCAIVGGGFVIMRMILQFVGAGGHHTGGDFHDVHDIDTEHADSDASFKLLSLHGLTSFAMMFGLVGFALYRQNAAGILMSLIGAMAAGLASVWIIGKLFEFTLSLQSSGTLSIQQAIGGEGSVYLNIPPRGSGRVMITFNNRLREFDAISHDQEGIKTGERVRVVGVANNMLMVERIVRKELPQS